MGFNIYIFIIAVIIVGLYFYMNKNKEKKQETNITYKGQQNLFVALYNVCRIL